MPRPSRRLHGPTQAVRVAPSGKKAGGGIAVVRNLRDFPDEERQPLAAPCNPPVIVRSAVIGFQLLVFLILLSVVAVVWLVTRDKR